MKQTSKLTVIPDFYVKDSIHIHPNDGFDLELMNNEYEVKFFLNTTVQVFNEANNGFFQGKIVLDNDCEHGKIRISKKNWAKLGKPDNVILFFEDNKILVANA